MHLKSITAPTAWNWTLRKTQHFVQRPLPGSQPLKRALPLSIVLRRLGHAKNKREIRAVLQRATVQVNGVRVRELRFGIGLMDTLSIPESKEYYRVFLDAKGRLELKPVSAGSMKAKPCKIIGKRVRGKDKIQLNTSDGRNVLVKRAEAKNCQIGDSLVLAMPENKVLDVLKFAKGAEAWLIDGKHVGMRGTIQEVKEREVLLDAQGKTIRALREHAFVSSKELES